MIAVTPMGVPKIFGKRTFVRLQSKSLSKDSRSIRSPASLNMNGGRFSRSIDAGVRDYLRRFSHVDHFGSKGSILGHMLLHNININTHISNILVYLRNLYDLQKSRYQTSRAFKISFLRFSRKVSILVHMLLHNININVAIANISMQFLSLYEPQEPRYPKINSKHFHCSLNCP